MNRGYSFAQIKEFLSKIRKVSPDTFIITHFMVGFPGETWIDFLKTLKTIIYFDFAHVIIYSDREGTPSSLFENKVSPYTKTCRFLIINIFLYINFIRQFFLSVKNLKR
jgi:tRNA-2-methylthio-N6-dimethylallyladenosine synthase